MPTWSTRQHGGRGILCVKVAQRLTLLPPPAGPGEPPVRVLDAYAGDGEIWRWVTRWRPDVEVTSIEKDPSRGKGAIRADNRRVLKAMDLTQFSVLDLDAWGQPTDQLAIAHDRGFDGVVFWTFIATYPRGSHLLLDAAAIPRAWSQIAPTTMFGQGGVFDLWVQFLAVRGWPRMAVTRAGQGRYYGAVGFDRFDSKVYEDELAKVMESGIGARYGSPRGM